MIHKIGLRIDIKCGSPYYAAYLVYHAILTFPVLPAPSKKLIAKLLKNQSNHIELTQLNEQNSLPQRIDKHLCRLMRLAIIFANRQRDDALPAVELHAIRRDATRAVAPKLVKPASAAGKIPGARKLVAELYPLAVIWKKH
ncbi:hypothetical protein BG74_06220 [Sodalis-like endosymbiont of Proechinophthirus fluctus]|nr:hypothetical protein BG74_06220 [Sodalis-like endosymbiont of Proechinophthirus fluctus]